MRSVTRQFDVIKTRLQDLAVLRRTPIRDDRGSFERMFCMEELSPVLKGRHIVQINRSITTHRGTVRGMHFQVQPSAEAKFVTCLRGEVYDVTVDLRRNSPTFLRWHAERLVSTDPVTIAIPEGFAHGFQSLTDESELLYLHTAFYDPDAERGLNILDETVGIRWPLPIAHLSERDSRHPFLSAILSGLDL